MKTSQVFYSSYYFYDNLIISTNYFIIVLTYVSWMVVQINIYKIFKIITNYINKTSNNYIYKT